MNEALSVFLSLLMKVLAFALVVREVRGFIMAAPVLYGMYQAGGTLMAVWIGFCSLVGIALSLFVPLFIARRLQRRLRARMAAA